MGADTFNEEERTRAAHVAVSPSETSSCVKPPQKSARSLRMSKTTTTESTKSEQIKT